MVSIIVTIDGPAGSGKSTAARLLAERLGFDFLDTGAMYRAVALKCLTVQVDLADSASVGRLARETVIEALGPAVRLDGRDVTSAIRAGEVAHAASQVAAVPEVREAMVLLQRRAAEERRIVSEGRDQGTVVFPDALAKFYLTARPEIRARRRQLELAEQGEPIPFDELLVQIRERDNRDKTRETSPLRQADDAMRIDTSEMTPEETAQHLEAIVRQRMACRD